MRLLDWMLHEWGDGDDMVPVSGVIGPSAFAAATIGSRLNGREVTNIVFRVSESSWTAFCGDDVIAVGRVPSDNFSLVAPASTGDIKACGVSVLSVEGTVS